MSQFGLATDDKRKLSLQTAVSGIIKPRLEEIFALINNEIVNSGFQSTIPAGIVLTGGGALTVNVKEISSNVIPLPLRISTPPKIGGLVDDILNPAYSSSVGLLMYGLKQNPKASFGSTKKSKISLNGIIGKFKNLIEPLLP
jgi:cell division protein FtsA